MVPVVRLSGVIGAVTPLRPGLSLSGVAKTIERGQKQGEISRKLDADVAAKFVLNNIAGLRLMGTMSPSSGNVRQVVEMVLGALE